jgi:hypothetical protein
MAKCLDRHSGVDPSIGLCGDDWAGLIDDRSTDPIHVIGNSGINPEDRARDLRKFMDSSYRTIGPRDRDPARSSVSR